MTKSFNTKIGVITNIASNMISLKSTYNENTPEYKELDKRIRLLRYYQGTCIDSAKGDVFVPPPKVWSKKQKFIQIPKDATESERKELQSQNDLIAFNNRIAVDRKAYFFGYVYPNLKAEYDVHVKSYRALCKQLHHSTISQLLSKQDKTKREQQLIRNYYKYMPLLRNNCIMNILAYYIEDIEFDNKWAKTTTFNFDYNVLLSKYFVPSDKSLLKQIRKLIAEAFCEYNKRMRVLYSENDMVYDTEYVESVEQNIFRSVEQRLMDKLYQLSSNKQDISNYVIYCFYNYFDNKPKAWMWEICGNDIIQNLKSKASIMQIPVESEDGVEYLGKKYKLESVNLISDNN